MNVIGHHHETVDVITVLIELEQRIGDDRAKFRSPQKTTAVAIVKVFVPPLVFELHKRPSQMFRELVDSPVASRRRSTFRVERSQVNTVAFQPLPQFRQPPFHYELGHRVRQPKGDKSHGAVLIPVRAIACGHVNIDVRIQEVPFDGRELCAERTTRGIVRRRRALRVHTFWSFSSSLTGVPTRRAVRHGWTLGVPTSKPNRRLGREKQPDNPTESNLRTVSQLPRWPACCHTTTFNRDRYAVGPTSRRRKSLASPRRVLRGSSFLSRNTPRRGVRQCASPRRVLRGSSFLSGDTPRRGVRQCASPRRVLRARKFFGRHASEKVARLSEASSSRTQVFRATRLGESRSPLRGEFFAVGVLFGQHASEKVARLSEASSSRFEFSFA